MATTTPPRSTGDSLMVILSCKARNSGLIRVPDIVICHTALRLALSHDLGCLLVSSSPPAEHVADVMEHEALCALAVAEGKQIEQVLMLVGRAQQLLLRSKIGEPDHAGLATKFGDKVDESLIVGEREQRAVERRVCSEIGLEVATRRALGDAKRQLSILLDGLATHSFGDQTHRRRLEKAAQLRYLL